MGTCRVEIKGRSNQLGGFRGWVGLARRGLDSKQMDLALGLQASGNILIMLAFRLFTFGGGVMNEGGIVGVKRNVKKFQLQQETGVNSRSQCQLTPCYLL